MDVAIDETDIDLRIDSGTQLQLFDVLLVQDKYNGKNLICGSKRRIVYSEEDVTVIDEFQSSWGVALEGDDSAENEITEYSVSKVTVYLH